MIRLSRHANALAIDPGYARNTGGNACAAACDGQLVNAWFERSQNFDRAVACSVGAQHVIVEQPQQDGRSWTVPPGVLIHLAFEGACLAALYAGATGARLHAPTVSEWKGSENKVPMHRRLWAILTKAERLVLGGDATGKAITAAVEKGAMCRWSQSGAELYPSKFTTHNLLDAAALLMVALGRLEKVG